MKTVISVIVFCGMGSVLVWGQATAQIHGVVQDMSGAAVSGAQIKATQTETGISRTVASEADGGFVLATLPIGPYSIEVSKDGFTTAAQNGIVLQVNSDPSLTFALKVGAVSDRVTVEANASQVETRSVGVGTVIENQRVLDLPLNGRQPTDLITLSGLAVQTGSSPPYSMNTGVNISVAGSTSYSIQYNLDGASHLNTTDGTNMPLPFPEALQEFRLVTSTQDASGGGHSGASVNAVTKSGTNAIHGDAFEFFRNGDLNGRDFFATANDQLKRNQFGGVIGGPIKKDNLFFFFGLQGTITRQTPSATFANVPTAADLTGDFSAFLANGCGIPAFGPTGAPIVQATTLSPAALKISALLPQGSGPCGVTSYGVALNQNVYQAPARLDYQISDKQSLFGRYLVTKMDQKVPYDIDHNLLDTATIGTNDMAQSLTLGDTYVVNASVVNSFRVFGNRIGMNHPAPSFFTPAQEGINAFSYIPNFTALNVITGPSIGFGANFSTGTSGYTSYGINDDINWVRGSHQFAFGGMASRAILDGTYYAWSTPVMLMIGIPNFLMGSFASGGFVHQANPNPDQTSQKFFGLYVNDTWKVNSKLTVNYGVRWNPFFPMQFINSDTSTFSLANYYAGKTSSVVKNAPPGFTYPGDPGFNGQSGLPHRYDHFEPRMGFAWDPTGAGKMVVRGGAGLSYDFIRQDSVVNVSSQAPFRITVVPTTFASGVSLDNPFGTFGNPFPYTYNSANPTFPTNIPYQGFYPIPADIKTTQQYSWNLGIQRQFTPSLFASATYVGTHLNHIWNAVDLNPAVSIAGAPFIASPTTAAQNAACAALQANCPTNVNQRRILNNPLLGTLTAIDDGGTQNYDGLLLSANWRKGNVNVGGNYTWSHCIGLPVETLTNLQATYPHEAGQNAGPVDRNLDVGDCYSGVLDVRQIANVTVVANTPKYRGGSFAKRLLSSWTLSTIYTVRSGSPMTLYMNSDVAMNGLYSALGAYPTPQRPNQVLANTGLSNQLSSASCGGAPCLTWFNPNAFAQPAFGTYGNMGVADLRGPGFWEWDQTISRQFAVTESQHVELRFEAFNVTNSPRWYMPLTAGTANVQLGSTSFGNITTTTSTTGSTSPTGNSGRVLQFALKYVF